MNPRPRGVRPGAVLLLTFLCLAAALAFFPDYWDWDLHRLRADIGRDVGNRLVYAASLAAADERRATENARIAARLAPREPPESLRGVLELPITDAVAQADGRIVAVLRTAGDGAVVGLARWNADGSLDEPFVRRANWENAGGLTGVAQQVVLGADGSILLAGRFEIGGQPRPLIRFAADGTLDAAFVTTAAALASDAGFGTESRVAVQPDGDIVFVPFRAASFTATRLRRDGVIEHGWDPARERWDQPFIGVDGVLVPRPAALVESDPPFMTWPEGPILRTRAGRGYTVAMDYLGTQPDGRILLLRQRELELPGPYPPSDVLFCGNDTGLQRAPWESHLVRAEDGRPLDALGLRAGVCDQLSLTFHVASLAFQPDGSAILAGDLPVRRAGTDGGCDRVAVWRVTADGELDPQFRMTTSTELGPGREPPAIRKVLVLGDGSIVIAGAFTSVQGQPRRNLARLRPDGTLE